MSNLLTCKYFSPFQFELSKLADLARSPSRFPVRCLRPGDVP